MLNQSSTRASDASISSATSFILIGSILAGALLGHFSPAAGQQLGGLVDYTLLLLVGLLFFGVRFRALMQAAGNWRFLAIALLANFVLVPLIGYGIASLLLSAHPLFLVGLVIYFMAPCTDWFLGFTRLSGGNVALGTTLLPINMVLQLLVYAALVIGMLVEFPHLTALRRLLLGVRQRLQHREVPVSAATQA